MRSMLCWAFHLLLSYLKSTKTLAPTKVIHAFWTNTIIHLALAGILQRVIGFADLLKLLLCFLITLHDEAHASEVRKICGMMVMLTRLAASMCMRKF